MLSNLTRLDDGENKSQPTRRARSHRSSLFLNTGLLAVAPEPCLIAGTKRSVLATLSLSKAQVNKTSRAERKGTYHASPHPNNFRIFPSVGDEPGRIRAGVTLLLNPLHSGVLEEFKPWVGEL